MRRAFALSAALGLFAIAAAGAPSCSSETTTATDSSCPTAGATPRVSIASPADGACVEVGEGDDAFIPVVVALENFKLDPPGACAECTTCGHLALRVNGEDNNFGAAAIIDVVFRDKIANHYGDMDLTVELVGDDGSPWTGDPDAGTSTAPLTASVKITTAKSCSDAGTGGAGGASSSSSSSSGGGAGGAGGASSSSSGGGAGGAGGAASSSSSGGTGGMGAGGTGTGGMGTGGMGTGGMGTGGMGTGGA